MQCGIMKYIKVLRWNFQTAGTVCSCVGLEWPVLHFNPGGNPLM